MASKYLTVGEFVEYLSSMSHLTEVRKWLRSMEGKSCPITAVCKSMTKAHFVPDEFARAAKKIGLRPRDASRIQEAADGTEGPLRNKLLKAVRLTIE